MLYLDQTLGCPAENLALDRELLARSDQSGEEYLRVWHPDSTFVVIGRGNQAAEHVDLDSCRRDSIPVLRRDSGGGAVVLGRGCLCYSVIVNSERDPALQTAAGANRYLLERIRDAIGCDVALAGDSDLTIGTRKIAGHAQRRKRRSVLFHGSLIATMKLKLIDAYLKHPPRMPGYRSDRSHAEFVRNHDVDPRAFENSLRRVFGAKELANKLFGRDARRIAATEWSDPHWRIL